MEHLSAAVFQILSMIMAFLTSIGTITMPSTQEPITASDGTPLLSFVAFGDSQVSNYNLEREPYVIEMAEDIKNAQLSLDAFVIAGDITENGFKSEYDRVYEDISGLDVGTYIIAAGNHDIRLREYENCSRRVLDFMNKLNNNDESKKQNSLYYSTEINGFKFIVIASEKSNFEDAYISSTQLTWLNEELKSAGGKPVFVITHYPLKDTHGLPDTWSNALWESGSIGDSSDKVKEILNRYENVFFITGHLHTGFGQYTYEKPGNFNSINLPSVGIENKDGDYNEQGCGFLVEVYENSVIFRARNFAKGEYLPDYDLVFNY